jgi:hypothetical protein
VPTAMTAQNQFLMVAIEHRQDVVVAEINLINCFQAVNR